MCQGFLLYGREPISNIDTIFPYVPIFENLTLADATCRSEECRQIARSRTIDTQAAAKLRYDEQHRHVAYSDGDLVWLWVPIRKPGLAEKHICQYVGPYSVLRRISHVTYRVEPVTPPKDRRYRSTGSAHVSRLKSYISPSLAATPAT